MTLTNNKNQLRHAIREKRMFRKAMVSGALVASLALPAVAEEFVIGAVNAKTGFMASYDAPFMQGVSMFVAEANERGGLAGQYPIRLIERDDRSDIQQSTISTSEILSDEKLDLFITSALVPYAVSAGMQALSQGMMTAHGIASQPTIPARLGEGSFLVMMSDAHMGAVNAKYALDDLSAKTAYIISSDFDPFTEFTPLYFQEVFEAGGGKVVGHSEFAYDQQEFSSMVAAIKALPEQPDVIMGMTFDNDFPIFINQLRAAGITSTYLGTDVLDQPAVRGLGEVVEGVHYLTMAAPNASDDAASFVDRFKVAYGGDDSFYPAMVGYSFMRLVEQASINAGSGDAKAIRAAFAELEDVTTEIGSVTLKGYGALPNLPVHIMRIEGGKGVYVKSTLLTSDEIPDSRI
ncbi:ABC transporter substrate-binding protein [Parasedimentitalea maritima]|uniref:ABC transporter substrate-binding protein n=2 Tax=Parasedimentitalea maritima TaxID=2578117 RepID=A0A6A4REF8_9RHOB|nr:ABC transporter substrate-binding protein [Zongyanglinia marina]